MGVPKFYRWISERYPKINQIVSDNALLPEFDHLYLDMNGIIHGCTHPNDRDISDGLSERDMMLGIMHYLDRIITQIVKPQVSVYMAIDGVAPRAKLNQQRSRRFRSAKDLAEATKDLPKDEDGKGQAVFDSNCITPGTEFLAKVSETIQYFIRKKLKEDPLWHGLSIIFSGHDIPGEGEHKIMQHIREMRVQPNYQPNTRHCIYGQDADLIMLGLVTHEPHFTILREVVNFNSFNTNKNTLKEVKKFTKESDFQLLHLSVLREYLQIEFANQQPEFDLERIIDDFVFMTFLVGNDFLPHMPTLDIGDGAFDLLFGIYKEQRHGWGPGNYLTESGEISDPSRLEHFIAAIGAVETEILEQREKDDAVYIKKKRRWDKRDGNAEGPSDEQLKQIEMEKQGDYLTMMETVMSKYSVGDFVDGWTPVQAGEKDYKGRYYYEKMKMTPVDKDAHWELRRFYMEGLRWCLAYYYKGCISWGWFYPYHYGPMLSDLTNIPKMFDEIQFELGAPLTPFQQLMGCLPPGSSSLVPPLYRVLMMSPESPIFDFYPVDFAVDMNGKKNPWEGVNLLNFIDINKLKEVVAKHCPPSKLSPAEQKRNKLGKVYCYRYDPTCTDTVESPVKGIGLSDIVGSHTSSNTMEVDLGFPTIVFKPVLIAGTQIPYPGFPSLNVMPIASVELTPMGLNCFGSPSKYPNTILTMHQMPELPPLEQLAENVLGRSLFVNWPMMHEGQVVAISDSSMEIRLVKGKPKKKDFPKQASDRWYAESEIMSQMYHVGNGVPGSGGIQIGDIQIRLKVLPLQGMKTNPSNGSTKKLFGNEEADVPLQLALWQAPAPDPRFVERGPMTLRDRYPDNCNVVLTKGKFRGSVGIVVGVADAKNVGVKVLTVPPEMPFGLAIARSVQESFVSSSDAARILKINPGVFGKIMGRLQFEQGKYDLGLNLKSPDGMCVVGYTRKKVEQQQKRGNKKGQGKKNEKSDSVWNAGDSVLVVGSRPQGLDDDEKEERIQWEYTPKAIRCVQAYRDKFPQLFALIGRKPNEKRYDANEAFGPNGEAKLAVVREWLDNHESAKIPRSPVTTETMSYDATAAVQKAADVRSVALKKKGYPKEVMLKIPGSALYREGSTGATDVLLSSDLNDGERPELGDRVANLCADGVPFGARGTVIGIHEAATTGSVEVVMDEEFIGGTSLQGHCANFRGKLCLWSHLLKIAPDNSKGLVDKLVPKGSQQAAVDQAVGNLISNIDTEGPARVASSWDSQVDTAAMAMKKDSNLSSDMPTPTRNLSAAERRAASRTPPRSSSRAGSTGRGSAGKQYREARKPDDEGVGFKGLKKGGVSGFARWKKMIKPQPSPARMAETSVDQTAADLKKMLGVSPPASSLPIPAAGDQLKAMLGVSNQQTARATPPPPTMTDGLKAMLGVQSTAPPTQQPQIQIQQRPPVVASQMQQQSQIQIKQRPPQQAPQIQIKQRPPQQSPQIQQQPQIQIKKRPPQQAPQQQPQIQIQQRPPQQAPQIHQQQEPARPLTAAEKLLQMMSGNQQQQQGPHMYGQPHPPPPSSFNFTYVEEGKEVAPPQPPAMPLPYPSFPMQPVMNPMHQLPITGYGSLPPPHPPKFAGFPSPPLPSGPPPSEFPPLGGPPDPDFPPLGAQQTPAKAPTAVPTKEPPSIMVPSVLAAKGRR